MIQRDVKENGRKEIDEEVKDDSRRHLSKEKRFLLTKGEIFEGSKIRLKSNEMIVRGIDHTGRSYTQRYKFEKDGDYKWVENEAE